MRYPVISVERTGKRIRDICVRQGICAKEIQEYMGWLDSYGAIFKGKRKK